MISSKKVFLILFLCSVFLFSGIGLVQAKSVGCSAEPCPPGQVCIPNPLEACSLGDLIETIAILIFNIALIVAPIMIIIGGFFFVTAAGNPEGIKTGNAIIKWTLIGFFVILIAKSIISFFTDFFIPS